MESRFKMIILINRDSYLHLKSKDKYIFISVKHF